MILPKLGIVATLTGTLVTVVEERETPFVLGVDEVGRNFLNSSSRSPSPSSEPGSSCTARALVLALAEVDTEAEVEALPGVGAGTAVL